jgi:preprotein translocase subunit SecE
MAVSTRRRSEAEAQRRGAGPVQVVREVYDELRKVVWPTPGELYRYTLVVVVTVVIISTFIGGVDYAVGEAVKRWVYAGVAGH